MVKDVYKPKRNTQRGITVNGPKGKYLNPNEARAQQISRLILIGLALFLITSIASAQPKYRVKAVSANGKDTSTSNTAKAEKKGFIYYPSTFTPNGDGLNEKFSLYLNNVKSFSCSIFSREGQLIADWNTPSGYWDGDGASEGIYIVMIEWTDYSGNTHEEFNKLALVR